jgi:hypothetical protein
MGFYLCTPRFQAVGCSLLPEGYMAESIQRILKRRALDGQHPKTPQQIIERFETVARVWNQHPTPFEWGGKRAARRQRARSKRPRHRLGGSGAVTQSLVA